MEFIFSRPSESLEISICKPNLSVFPINSLISVVEKGDELFDSDSLEVLTSKFLNPNYIPTETDYLQLVVKYGASFLWLDPRESLSGGQYREIPKHIRRLNDRGYYYSLEMLLSVGSTAKIVQDIISRELQPSKGEKYFGLDLGTGTGILLFAQYIQARRNWYNHRDIINIGIEKNPIAAHYTERVMDILKFWRVFVGDSTEFSPVSIPWEEARIQMGKKYSKRNSLLADTLWKQPITFLSNENIPHPWTRFSTLKWLWLDIQEPFFHNIANLDRQWLIDLDTQMFPSGISISYLFGDTVSMPDLSSICEQISLNTADKLSRLNADGIYPSEKQESTPLENFRLWVSIPEDPRLRWCRV